MYLNDRRDNVRTMGKTLLCVSANAIGTFGETPAYGIFPANPTKIFTKRHAFFTIGPYTEPRNLQLIQVSIFRRQEWIPRPRQIMIANPFRGRTPFRFFFTPTPMMFPWNSRLARRPQYCNLWPAIMKSCPTATVRSTTDIVRHLLPSSALLWVVPETPWSCSRIPP